MSRALAKLPQDIRDCILDNPMTAKQIADELNGLYMGSLNGPRVAKYLMILRGQNLARVCTDGNPKTWVAVESEEVARLTVDQCSIDAYYQTEPSRDVQRSRVYDCIRTHPHLSSADIAVRLNMQRTSVTGRLRELEKGSLIRKGGRKRDARTNVTVNWYEVIQ